VTLPGSKNFSDEATGLYATAVTSYADTLESLSKHCALNAELVLMDHVKDALSLLGPTGKSVLLDWIKRSAFLFIGVAITLGIQLFMKPGPPGKGDVMLFVVMLLIATAFLVIGLIGDFPWFQRHLFRRS